MARTRSNVNCNLQCPNTLLASLVAPVPCTRLYIKISAHSALHQFCINSEQLFRQWTKIFLSSYFKKLFTMFVLQALIIEEKDASSIPLSIVMVSTIVSFMWCLYSLAINNGFLLVRF